MKYLSLFSGIGGFELGIQQAHEDKETSNNLGRITGTSNAKNRRNKSLSARSDGEGGRAYTCVGYSEIDKYAIQIYERHFKHTNFGDIKKIRAEELPDFDLICGGFPCQSFSIAGKRGGFEDTRGTLFFDIARIIKAKRPRLVFLENVKGLLSHDDGRTFNTIILTLDELGYDLQWQVLNSKNFGVPQNRERVFIIGHLRGTPRPKVFPIGKSNSKDISQLNSPTHSNDRIYGEEGISPALNTMQGGRRQPLITRQPLRFLKRNQRNIEGDYFYSLDASQTNGLKDGNKIRRLTPTECERLQGFPDNWTRHAKVEKRKDERGLQFAKRFAKEQIISDTQRYKTLGNAVTVNVIKEIAKRLL